ncbi:MAG TPA: energy transducer TonB [Acidisarcina sp.]
MPLVSQSVEDPTRKVLESTIFTLALDDQGRPSVEHHYPTDSSANEQQGASNVTNLLTSLLSGLFQTWPSKGLQGPIPPFDSQIEMVTATDTGYTINFRVPGAPVQMLLDKSYLVTEIISADGKLDEHPSYVSSPEGLVFAGSDAVDASGQEKVEVKYELGTSVINGLRVPSSVRLRVNQNIDVKFGLDGCSVNKATIARVATPALEVPESVMAAGLEHVSAPTLPKGTIGKCSNAIVVLKVSIDKSGKVSDQDFVSGFEELKDSALAAIKDWTYKPYEQHGKAVAVQTTASIFYLGDGESFPVYSPNGKGGVKGGNMLPLPPGCGSGPTIKRTPEHAP